MPNARFMGESEARLLASEIEARHVGVQAERNGSTMKRLLWLTLVLIMLNTLTGCAKTVSGTYVDVKNNKSYLELKSDGTWYLQDDYGHGYTGKYTIDGNTITIDNGGRAARFTINGDTITDSEGDKLVKK
ncbi:hypothetical protein JCM15765_24550 [Paradesulfitobacterium aromaticivorans]